MKYIITLDIGTSSMRAILYRENGDWITSCGQEYHSVFPKPSYVEQDAKTWADAATVSLSGIAQYLKEHGLHAEGIAVTSQRSSLIPVDRHGEPLRSAIMWQDKRTIEECGWLRKECGMHVLHRITGLRVNPYFVLPKLMWLRENEPNTYRDAYRFVGVQDYVVFQLIGEFKTDWTQACRTMLMNIESFDWDESLMDLAGITAERLPELVPPGTKAGELTSDMAEKTGLPAGLPVIVCGGDQQNAAVGLGVVKKGLAEVNTGTGSFVLSYAERPVFDDACRVLCQASAIAGKWVTEAGIFNTGAIYRWFKEQFCPDLNTSEAYRYMDDEARKAGPGAHGVVMIPHFEGSAAPYWNPMAKGLFFNLSLGTTRGDLARSILEGVSMEIADNLTLIQLLSGELNRINVAGGMVKSDLFCQIQASCYNKPVVRYQNSEATSLGAVIVASPALGVHANLEEACSAMASPEDEVFQAIKQEADVYEKMMAGKQRLYFTLSENKVYEEFMGV